LALFRDIPLDKLLAQYAWNILTTQELLALPLFILMGEILFPDTACRSPCSTGWRRGLRCCPGRLLHVKRHRLLDLRRHLGIVGCDHTGGGAHLDQRTDEARLLEGCPPSARSPGRARWGS